ncbi:MAG: hypothetical protein ABIQ77_12725, partial [Anaerolineales bacterium]
VIIITAEITSSISASYYTDARDVFVGLLFVIGAFLLAYNGRSRDLAPDTVGKFWQGLSKFWSGAIEFRIAMRKMEERVVSLIGGVAAICAALFPTACYPCGNNIKFRIHIVAAVILFSTIAYFCLVAFRGQVKDATDKELKKKRRARIYSFCGWGIILVMLGLIAMQFTMPVLASTWPPITFLAETVALVLFGISWMTASKIFIWLADEEEQHKMSLDGVKDTGKVLLDQAQTA